MSATLSDDRAEEACKDKYCRDVIGKLNTIWRDGKYTDLVLKAKSSEFRCHKAVLTAACPYFEALFNSGMTESNHSTVVVKDIDPEICTIFLDFVYSGELSGVTIANVEETIRIADLFQCSQLLQACDIFLYKNLDYSHLRLDNSHLRFLMFGKTFRLNKFVKEHWAVIFHMFQSIACSSDEDLKIVDEETFIELIRPDKQIALSNENIVYEFLSRWINADPENREPKFDQLIQYVRLAFCTPKFLQEVVEVDPRMVSPECQRQLQEAKDFQMVPMESRHEIVTECNNPRKAYNNRVLWIVGGDKLMMGGQSLRDGKALSMDNREQFMGLQKGRVDIHETIFENLGKDINHPKYCMIKDALLVVGGNDVTSEVKSNMCIAIWVDNSQQTHPTIVRNLGSMLEGRTNHGAVLFGEDIYIFGGELTPDAQSITNHSEKITLQRDNDGFISQCSAESLPEMPIAVSSPMLAVLDGKVFIFGGKTADSEAVSATQVYDIEHQIWSQETDMPQACKDAAAVRYNDHIYVVGGQDKLCMRYTPSTDTWLTFQGPHYHHSNAPAVVWFGKILVGGGQDLINPGGENDGMSIMEHYEPKEDKWTTWKTKLPVGITGHSFFNVLDDSNPNLRIL